MIWLLLVNLINSIVHAIIAGIGSLLVFAAPVETIDGYFSAVNSIFAGIRALDVFIPVSEFIVFALIGLSLKVATSVFVLGVGAVRMAISTMMFWRG